MWDLRQFRCTRTFYTHKEGVWALSFDPLSNDHIVSGGRDKFITHVDTKKHEICIVAQSEHPILSVRVAEGCLIAY